MIHILHNRLTHYKKQYINTTSTYNITHIFFTVLKNNFMSFIYYIYINTLPYDYNVKKNFIR